MNHFLEDQFANADADDEGLSMNKLKNLNVSASPFRMTYNDNPRFTSSEFVFMPNLFANKSKGNDESESASITGFESIMSESLSNVGDGSANSTPKGKSDRE